MADVEGRASPPPLLAYTASKQVQRQEKLSRRAGRPKDKAKEKGKAGVRNRAGVSKTYNSNVSATPRPRFRKPEAAIVFDDSSRREYLTGFHKRKQAKLVKGRERAKEREREERRQMRQEVSAETATERLAFQQPLKHTLHPASFRRENRARSRRQRT